MEMRCAGPKRNELGPPFRSSAKLFMTGAAAIPMRGFVQFSQVVALTEGGGGDVHLVCVLPSIPNREGMIHE